MKKLIAAVAGLAILAPAALAGPSRSLTAVPSQSLTVSPRSTNPGKTVTINGTVDPRCPIGRKGNAATIYSKAFAGVTRTKFAGTPSVSVSLAKSRTRAFSTKVTLSTKLKTGSYSVTGRCGPGNFGSAKLKVVKAP